MSRIRTLVDLLQSEADVEVVGAADTGLDAVDAIRKLSPDLVFLDLQIPDLDGFGVISEVGHAMPLTIFATAYDEYALRAFDVARRLVSLVQDVGGPRPLPDRVMVKSGGRVVFLPLDELDAVESEGNYVRLGHDRFCRVHRGWIVNLDRVRELPVRG